MIRPTAVQPRDGRRIWLRYSDGASGEVDLSHLADGVFTAWNDPNCFASVHLTDYGAIAWNADIELCPDALYMRLTGKPLSDLYAVHPSGAASSAFARSLSSFSIWPFYSPLLVMILFAWYMLSS